MRHKKNGSSSAGKGRTISRRKFIGMTAGATAALSFGTFIRSGLGAAKVNVLTWSNTLNAMDDVLREQAKEYTKAKGVEILPIDSEHNAIFQVLPPKHGENLTQSGVKRILLTASGGPFRKASHAELAAVTPAQALNHPNWVMGPKITIDSATLMNKGLEVIEARWLFNATPDQVEVIVHPQSVIHSMVEYIDGSVK